MSDSAASPAATITALYRYPVKGLSGEPLQSITVQTGETIPGDRIYAIENGPGKFSKWAPKPLPKINFVMLMRHARLADFDTAFDAATHRLTLRRRGGIVAEGDLSDAVGRQNIEHYIATAFGDELRGPPRIVHAKGHSFSDVADKCLHIVNMASVRALQQAIGRPVDVRRFRANLVLDGIEAWTELEWVGKTLHCDSVELQVFKRTERCQAIAVNPETAARDIDIISHLRQTLGHTDFGIYAKVQTSGALHIGDGIEVSKAR